MHANTSLVSTCKLTDVHTVPFRALEFWDMSIGHGIYSQMPKSFEGRLVSFILTMLNTWSLSLQD